MRQGLPLALETTFNGETTKGLKFTFARAQPSQEN